jgi:hypothetical protein
MAEEPDPYALIDDPELREAVAAVTDFVEQRSSMPGLDPKLIGTVHSDTTRGPAYLLARHLTALLLHAGGPHPVPVLVRHQGPYQWYYVAAGATFWVEGRAALYGKTEPPEYGIWEMRPGRELDKSKPDAFAATQLAAKEYVRRTRAAQLAAQQAAKRTAAELAAIDTQFAALDAVRSAHAAVFPPGDPEPEAPHDA